MKWSEVLQQKLNDKNDLKDLKIDDEELVFYAFGKKPLPLYIKGKFNENVLTLLTFYTECNFLYILKKNGYNITTSSSIPEKEETTKHYFNIFGKKNSNSDFFKEDIYVIVYLNINTTYYQEVYVKNKPIVAPSVLVRFENAERRQIMTKEFKHNFYIPSNPLYFDVFEHEFENWAFYKSIYLKNDNKFKTGIKNETVNSLPLIITECFYKKTNPTNNFKINEEYLKYTITLKKDEDYLVKDLDSWIDYFAQIIVFCNFSKLKKK